MLGLANTAFLSRFLFTGLLRVAPYCAPGGIRVVSILPENIRRFWPCRIGAMQRPWYELPRTPTFEEIRAVCHAARWLTSSFHNAHKKARVRAGAARGIPAPLPILRSSVDTLRRGWSPVSSKLLADVGVGLMLGFGWLVPFHVPHVITWLRTTTALPVSGDLLIFQVCE